MIKTVLLVGASGFVGTQLALSLREGYKVFGTYNANPVRIPGVTAIPLRFQNPSSAKQVMALVQPDIVVFAAGSSSPEFVERFHRDEEKIHTGGAGSVFTSSAYPPRLIYLSSPYVFDGMKGNFRETDLVLPANTLGRVKLSGENFVRGKSINYVIVRTSPVLGRGTGLKPSLLDLLRTRLARGERLELSAHETHSFVPVWSVVEIVHRLIESGYKNRVFHLGGLTKLSILDLGQRFARRFGYDPALVQSPNPAVDARPGALEHVAKDLDFSVNSSQLVEALKFQPLLLEECFDLIEKKLVSAP
jgi:dTDP-4-dehydrorhamnose reductase